MPNIELFHLRARPVQDKIKGVDVQHIRQIKLMAQMYLVAPSYIRSDE